MPRIRVGDLDDEFDDAHPSVHVHRSGGAPGRRTHPAWDRTHDDPELACGARRSTYQESRASQGPQPPPPWLVTTSAAIDHDRGLVKTGKEADIELVERADPISGTTCLLAHKRYRSSQHRLFHRDAGYLEGRRVRRSREMRAMSTRTQFGKAVIAAQWAEAEFAALARLWTAGVPVPYPVQSGDTSLLLEFIGDDAGAAAPRLAELRPAPDELDDLFEQCRSAMRAMAADGLTHGDLSAYNLLVHHGRLVVIDLPQVVDIVGNPQGPEYLQRDCANVCAWFTARGHADADPDDLAAELLADARMR